MNVKPNCTEGEEEREGRGSGPGEAGPGRREPWLT